MLVKGSDGKRASLGLMVIDAAIDADCMLALYTRLTKTIDAY